MEFRLDTGKGRVLAGDLYKPAADASKVLLLLHGLGDHFRRYASWSTRFTGNGIAVIGLDLPGHGRSPGKRGHISGYHEYNSIIESLARHAVEIFGDLPMGLYGHSLGGNIALNYLLTNTYGFKFAVITSPWLKLVSPPSASLLAIARIVNRIYPSFLQANGLKLEHISRAEDVQQKYDSDPYVHDRVSVRLGIEATDAARRILETGRNIDIPVLLVHGEDDKITSADGSKALADLNDNIEVKTWEKGYHELHNESFNDEVFNYIHSWLLKH